ncbi:SACOL1771 family peroxiredoxin [Staphylococcus americanisciuri]|uniref:SACOL1771 family peroxiredoxin n=1 Tax=Staphylococcus americanisciuri TaxID=2973940 RepID=A0ABT2EYK4_9STAP|nr:SACOL1771 family peroxiredoxin [Staphylococcus americanisciuri]MCS4485335.1 SACOL1771 family peroxiredoxin [Staphylococcus americanisciuri]
MVQHDFPITVTWQGGRDEIGQLSGEIVNHKVSIPRALGGKGIGTNPDELLVAAAASCMTISLAATLERAHLIPLQIDMHSTGTASFSDGKFRMVTITHRPTITLSDERQLEKLTQRIQQLISIADRNCMVSNSLRGNVAIEIIPNLRVRATES